MRNPGENEPNIYGSPDYGGDYGGKEPDETGGIKAIKHVAEFMECKSEELGNIFQKVELTKQYSKNDLHHIDIFLSLRGGLTCCVDASGSIKNKNDAGAERLKSKHRHQSLMSFKCRSDEKGRPISALMPFFVVDDVNLKKWIDWGEKADKDGIPITDVMTKEDQDEEYKFLLVKMWQQAAKIYREGTYDQKTRIIPYRNLFGEELGKVLSPKEKKAFDDLG
jgi:hypothetical protein